MIAKAASAEHHVAKLRPLLRVGRGRNLQALLGDLAAVLRGWVSYDRLADVKGVFEALDKWIRRTLRAILWRQWRRPRTRLKALRRLGLDTVRATVSAFNGHGPWWNAGASHMHAAVPTRRARHQGLVSLVHEHRRFTCSG